jgi:hypothetical protein
MHSVLQLQPKSEKHVLVSDVEADDGDALP